MIAVLDKLRNAVRSRVIEHYGAGFDISFALRRMKANNFTPSHIFDVGAYRGEFAQTCREIWPEARLTCFEVLPSRVEELLTWSKTAGNTEIIRCLLGNETRAQVTFYEDETASSVLPDSASTLKPVSSYPMKTVDEIVAAGTPAPSLLKMDVQGYEYEVIKGAKETLSRVDAVLAEVNIIDIYKGTHLLDELIALLREHNFVTYDICGFWRRPLDNALFQADFIFVPINSPLRTDKRWSA